MKLSILSEFIIIPTDEQGSKPNLSALPGTCFLANKPSQPVNPRDQHLPGSGVKSEQYLDPQYAPLHYQGSLAGVHCAGQGLRDSTIQLSRHLDQMAAMTQVQLS